MYSSVSSRLGWFVAIKTTTVACCRDVHKLPLEHEITAFYCLMNSKGIVGNVVAAHFPIYADFFVEHSVSHLSIFIHSDLYSGEKVM